MDFADQLAELGRQSADWVSSINTEEATKNALVMPFIKALGYNIFDPTEVIPEFTADIGEKKGEKVDYAIMKDQKPIILVECKPCGSELNANWATQLQRYFQGVSEVKFGILTDGVHYKFYSDLDRPNVMDSKPFLEVDLLNLQDAVVEELRRFTKPTFDAKDILSTAGVLKYTREIQSIFRSEFSSPSRNLVKFFTSKVYDGLFTKNVHARFTPIVKDAFKQFINKKINETLETAKILQGGVGSESKAVSGAGTSAPADQRDETEDEIVTSAEELQGYYIVKAILGSDIGLDRITMKDVRSYCGILLDNRSTKPICRLHFNNPRRKYLGLFDQAEMKGVKKEDRIMIKRVEDIYKYQDRLKRTIQRYESPIERLAKDQESEI